MKLHYLLAITVVLLFISGFFYSLHPDEQVFLQVAKVIKNGEVPYLNIFDNKPPGIYLIWFLISNFKFPVIIARITTIFANLISAWFIYLINQKISLKPNSHSRFKNANQLALLSSFSYLILLYHYQGQFAITEPFMVMWLLAGFYFFVKDKILNIQNAILAGFCIGMAFLFKQVAIVNIITILFFTTIICIQSKKTTGVLVVGLLLPWIPVVVYFYANSALQNFWYAMVVYNFTQYSPFPFTETVKELFKILFPIIAWTAGMFLFRYKVLSCKYQKLHKVKLSISKFKLKPLNFRFQNLFFFETKQRNILLLWLFSFLPIPLILTRPYHHYWLQILPFYILLIVHLTTTAVSSNHFHKL